MIGIGLIQLLLSFVVLYFVLYCVGSIVGRLVGFDSSSEPFFVKFPFLLSIGFVMLIPILFITGFLIVSSLIMWALLAASILVIVDDLIKKPEKKKQHSAKMEFVESLLPLALFLLATTYYLVSIVRAGWAPPGDIMSGSGPLVSLILYNHRLPLTPSPILMLYPPGFHVVAATFSEALGLYPVQSIFILGAVIAVLIPTTMYSLTYSITHSKTLSLLSFSSMFVISGSSLEEFVTGYFYNGVYPCFAGFLILIAYSAMTIRLIPDLRESRNFDLKRFSMVALLVVSALAFIYPPFAIFALSHFLIMMALKHREVSSGITGFYHSLWLSKAKLSILLLSSLFIVLGFLYFLVFGNGNTFEVLLGYLTATYVLGEQSRGLNKTSAAYLLPANSLFNSINGVLIVIGLAVAIYLILRRERLGISLLYIVIAVPVLFSLLGAPVSFLAIILPKRSLVLAGILSIPLTFVALARMLRRFQNSNSFPEIPDLTRKINRASKRVVPVLLVVMSCVVVLLPYASFDPNARWLWFKIGSQDFGALEWINRNVSVQDLILNDASFTGEFVLSLSLKNLTYSYYSWVTHRERAEALFYVWDTPFDSAGIFNLLQQYNVSYLLLTSEDSQLIWHANFSYTYVQKPYSSSYYAAIFDYYPFLEPLFEEDKTIIYKVHQADYILETAVKNKILKASDFWASLGSWGANGTIGAPIISNDSANIDIPSGSSLAFGIESKFETPQDWSEFDLLGFTFYSSRRIYLSLVIEDADNNISRFDYVSVPQEWINVTIPRRFFANVDSSKINRIALLTGYGYPFPEAGSQVIFDEFMLLRFSKKG